MKVLPQLLALVLAAASRSAADSLPVLDTLFGAARSETDVILRKDGTELRGQMANATVQIHTALGSLAVERRWIAGIQFDAGPGHLDVLILDNRNRLSGYINESLVLGTNLVSKLSARHFLAARGPERAVAAGQFAVLDNGDILSGRISLPAIQADTPSGPRAIPADQVLVVRFDPAGPVAVQLKDGREHAGRMDGPVRIELEFGPELAVPQHRLKSLSLRAGFIPAELRHAFAPPVSLSAEPPDGSTMPPGMVWIPPGSFVMGSPLSEAGRGTDEDPQTEVEITRGFWMGRCEVTQGEYLSVAGANPSNFQGDTNRPVEKVSWHEARAYCARLTERARERGELPAGYVYRLPTEAEWEYAARAGTTTRFSYGEDPTDASLHEYAWFIGNSDSASQPVGRLKPNRWGLHDMHGNVWEWCLDLWAGSYPGGSLQDYTGPRQGWLRAARGGSWLYAPGFCRSANRDDYGPEIRCSDIGFRVVLGPDLDEKPAR